MPVAEKIDKHGRQFMDIESILFMQNRMVFITDVIDDALASNVIKQLIYLASVSNEDITVVINSPGGSVTAGMAIYATIQHIKCDGTGFVKDVFTKSQYFPIGNMLI